MENHLQRSDTETTTPLTDDEFRDLQDLNNFDHSASTLDRILQTNQSSNVIADDWLGHPEVSGSNPPTPSTSQHILHPDGGNVLLRGDTLDRNPGFINPHEIETSSWSNTTSYVNRQIVKTEEQQVHHQQQETETFNYTNQTQHVFTNIVDFSSLQQQQQQQQQHQQHNIVLVPHIPSPTSANPVFDSWPGDLSFKVAFQRLVANTKNKSWDYSTKLNKLFIDFNKYLLACCTIGPNPPDGLFVRVLPIYAVNESLPEPVKRCPNHAEPSDASNQGFPPEFRWHLIRVKNDATMYEEDPISNRLSVVVPLERPQGGTEYSSFSMKFMCLGSDVGGINRRLVKVIFTLEQGPGHVMGRDSVDVRICSCPKRDKHQEEQRHDEKEAEVKALAVGLARANSNLINLQQSQQQPQNKKRKIDKEVEEMVMIPVAKADAAMFYQLAESQMIARNTSNANDIKVQRKKLYDRFNKILPKKE